MGDEIEVVHTTLVSLLYSQFYFLLIVHHPGDSLSSNFPYATFTAVHLKGDENANLM